jgi:hypothetical protein
VPKFVPFDIVLGVLYLAICAVQVLGVVAAQTVSFFHPYRPIMRFANGVDVGGASVQSLNMAWFNFAWLLGACVYSGATAEGPTSQALYVRTGRRSRDRICISYNSSGIAFCFQGEFLLRCWCALTITEILLSQNELIDECTRLATGDRVITV